jgi:DNA polymerase-3 subunit delta
MEALTPSPDVPAILIHGTDEFRVDLEVRRWMDAVCPPESRAFGLEEISGQADSADAAVQALRQCLSAVQTAGFLGGRKLVWFRNVTFLKNATLLKREAVRTWLDRLTALLKSGLPAGHQLLLSAPEVDGRSALVKAFAAKGRVAVFDQPERDYQAEPLALDTARAEFQRSGLRVPDRLLLAFIRKAGYESRRIHQEIEKLSLFLGPGGEVTESEIERLVSPTRESAGWDFSDALFRREPALALAVLRRLLVQREDPIALLGLLDNRCRDALLLLDCRDRRWVRLAGKVAEWRDDPEVETVLSALGDRDPRRMHPFRAGMLLQEAGPFPPAELERWRRAILRVREQVVSAPTPPELLLEFLVLDLTRRPAAPAPGPESHLQSRPS